MPFTFWLLYPAFKYFGMTSSAPLPTVGIVLRDFAISTVIMDALFYWVHRALHAFPYLYRKIHSTHHRFVAPVGIAAEYAHPVRSSTPTSSCARPLLTLLVDRTTLCKLNPYFDWNDAVRFTHVHLLLVVCHSHVGNCRRSQWIHLTMESF